MKNENLFTSLVIIAFLATGCSSLTNNSSKIIGEWTLDAFEAPPQNGETDSQMDQLIYDEYIKICKNHSLRYEFAADSQLRRYYDEDKTVESGTYKIQGDKLYEILDKGNLKASTGTKPQKIVKLDEKQLILESTDGFRRFFVNTTK